MRRKSKVTQTASDPSNNYGVNAQQVDIDPDKLQKLCEDNVTRMNLSQDEFNRTELETRKQGNCPLWHEMRKYRLTASRFGEVVKRRKTTPCARLVKEILYPRSVSSDSLRWGRENEKVAIDDYCKLKGNLVHPAGLFICRGYGYLGASPDGIVVLKESLCKGLVEVKCPYSAKELTPLEAAKRIKSFPLEVMPNG